MDNLARRIIPCLDIKNGSVVKGVNFVGLKDMGDPVALAQFYNDAGADESVILDITATFEHRKIIVELIKQISKYVYIPLTIGGGIRDLEDMYLLLDAGADKISLNSAAIQNPDLITQGAKRFGSQCIVVAIDVRSAVDSDKLDSAKQIKKEVYIKGGRENTHIEMCAWAKICEDKGAGEFLLTSMDTDGTKQGYDLETLKQMRQSTSRPIIASGGAGKKEDIAEIFKANLADAALAASIFHNNEISIHDLKIFLKQQNIPIRI